MMYGKSMLICLALGVAGFTYPATVDAYPNEHTDPRWTAEVERSVQWWEGQGVTGSCAETGIFAIVADSLIGDDGVDAAGRGRQSDCTVWITTAALELPEYSCVVGRHEVGHVFGLQHEDPRFPIMAASPQTLPECMTPVPAETETVERTNRSRRLTIKEARGGARSMAWEQADLISTTDKPSRVRINSCHKLRRTTVTCKGAARGGGTKCVFRAKLDILPNDESLYGFFYHLKCNKDK